MHCKILHTQYENIYYCNVKISALSLQKCNLRMHAHIRAHTAKCKIGQVLTWRAKQKMALLKHHSNHFAQDLINFPLSKANNSSSMHGQIPTPTRIDYIQKDLRQPNVTLDNVGRDTPWRKLGPASFWVQIFSLCAFLPCYLLWSWFILSREWGWSVEKLLFLPFWHLSFYSVLTKWKVEEGEQRVESKKVRVRKILRRGLENVSIAIDWLIDCIGHTQKIKSKRSSLRFNILKGDRVISHAVCSVLSLV